MLTRLKVPKPLQWISRLFLIYLLLFTCYRLLTYVVFKPTDSSIYNNLSCFILGILFDIRWTCIILTPLLVISLIPSLSPFYSSRNKKWCNIYLAIVTFLLLVFFGADMGSFAYDSTRLNAIALNFLSDASISLKMIWQSYPVIWICIGMILVIWQLAKLFKKLHLRVEEKNSETEIFQRNWYAAALFITVMGIYGSVSSKPLKWNDAFVMQDNFRSYLSLNPLQNFFTTLRFRKPDENFTGLEKYYPELSEMLALNKNSNNFIRTVSPGIRSLESKPNVVLVLCESFSMYKSSMSGNKLNTTPYFQSLTDKGVFFDRCFSPSFGTARGLFALLTGIPDVQLAKFSTQNELASDQHTIINDFKGYEKMYFLGGSSEFNDFNTLLKNVNGLKVYDEPYFKLPKVNVWGISDKDLFLQANEVFKQQRKPFFAIVQTADNHRPYTIPKEDEALFTKEIALDTLQKYGFESQEEYNAFSYMDHAIQTFMNKAKSEPYFDNTIFVFVGDHGVAGNASALYSKVWTEQRLTAEHIPLLFYAPKLLLPAKKNDIVSQLDVLPTIAGLSGIHYTNTTLGRDVLDPNIKSHNAFIIHHDEGKIGLLQDDYFFIKNFRFENEALLPLNGSFNYSAAQIDSIKKKASVVTSGIYETSKWMLLNNKRVVLR
jgi:phosphoglycerol transferase MdoB-like AlkP superfamily enzyme